MKTKAPTVQQQAQSRQLVGMVCQVQSGLLTAKEAARRLGLSRKTYYKWEKRILSSSMAAACKRPRGRPGKEVDLKTRVLEQRNRQLERKLQVLEQTVKIQRLLVSASKKNP